MTGNALLLLLWLGRPWVSLAVAFCGRCCLQRQFWAFACAALFLQDVNRLLDTVDDVGAELWSIAEVTRDNAEALIAAFESDGWDQEHANILVRPAFFSPSRRHTHAHCHHAHAETHAHPCTLAHVHHSTSGRFDFVTFTCPCTCDSCAPARPVGRAVGCLCPCPWQSSLYRALMAVEVQRARDTLDIITQYFRRVEAGWLTPPDPAFRVSGAGLEDTQGAGPGGSRGACVCVTWWDFACILCAVCGAFSLFMAGVRVRGLLVAGYWRV